MPACIRCCGCIGLSQFVDVMRYMESFDSLGEFADLDLLDHLDGVMLMNKKLMFLGEYLNISSPVHFLQYFKLLAPNLKCW